MNASFIAILVFFAIHVVLYLSGSIWALYHNKEQRDHSRILLGIFCLCMACSCAIFIGTALWAPAEKQFAASMLEPYPSIISFVVWTLMPLYLYEIRNPRRLTGKRLLLCYSPWLVLSIGFVVWHACTGFGTITPLTSWEAIQSQLDSTEVRWRIALALVFIPYGVVVGINKTSWRDSSAPQPWVNILAALVCAFTLTFIIGMLCRVESVMYLHTLIVDATVVLALYMEARVRFPAPEPKTQNDNATITRIAMRLKELVETGLWQNPDFGRDDYCHLLGTNRVYLAKAVQQLGYVNLADMINSYRLDSLHQLLQQYPKDNTLDLVFQVGFRNRGTADHLFAEKFGCSIAAYRRNERKNAFF